MLWNVYKEVLPTLDGNLNERGLLHLAYDQFNQNLSDIKWVQSKKMGAKKKMFERKARQNAALTSKDTGIPTANEFLLLHDIDHVDEDFQYADKICEAPCVREIYSV